MHFISGNPSGGGVIIFLIDKDKDFARGLSVPNPNPALQDVSRLSSAKSKTGAFH